MPARDLYKPVSMNLNIDSQELPQIISEENQVNDQNSCLHNEDANTSKEVVKQQNKESCLHKKDAKTSNEVVKNKDSFMPETRLRFSPKMKYSQQPAQGFAETYKLPFPQTQLFVPFQVFDLFQNTEASWRSCIPLTIGHIKK